MVSPMRHHARVIALLSVITLLFCFLLVTDLLPWLRGDVPWLPGDTAWRWPYALPRWGWVIPCILGVALYTVGAIRMLATVSDEPRYPVRLILWAFVGGVLLPLLLLTLEDSPLFLLFSRSASTVTGGYQFASTLVTDLSYPLRHWTDFVNSYREQNPLGGIALAPPGLVVVDYSFQKFFDAFPPLAHTFGALLRPLECQNMLMMTWSDAQFASAWPQLFMPLWTALAVAPLYKLGTVLFNHRVAGMAVLLWPLVPGLNMFAPRFNTFYALMAVVLLVMLWRGLDQKRPVWIVAAGFVMSVGTFINLSVVPLGLLCGLLIMGHWLMTARQANRIGSLIQNLALYGLGVSSIWLIYTGLTGVTLIDIYQLGLSLHFHLDRPYLPWLFMHAYDTFLFIGLPIAGLSIWRIISVRGWTPANVFAVATGLTLIIMVLSGTARGETGRVWLFFAPCWLLLAADWMTRFSLRQQRQIFMLEAVVLVCMAAVLHGNFTALTEPATLPTADHPATYPVDALFVNDTDQIRLVGLDVDPSPTQVVLHLHWRADSYVRRPYVFSLVSVAPDKTVRAGITWEPLGWKTPVPPTCWVSQQEIVDTVLVPLSGDGRAGNWWFSLSLVGIFDKLPMTVINADGSRATQVGIGPVNVPAR